MLLDLQAAGISWVRGEDEIIEMLLTIVKPTEEEHNL